jgi:hypothetical protein
MTAFVTGLFPFIDSLNKVHLRPETKGKLRKVREELDKELKAEAEKGKKEDVSIHRIGCDSRMLRFLIDGTSCARP